MNADTMRYGVHGSCEPGLSTNPICSGIAGSHSVWTPGELFGNTAPSTGVWAWNDTVTPRPSSP